MLKWLMWLQGEREAAKHEAEQVPEAAKPEVRRNPDRADWPDLNGRPLPKAKPQREAAPKR
jgi:hypothetical protein